MPDEPTPEELAAFRDESTYDAEPPPAQNAPQRGAERRQRPDLHAGASTNIQRLLPQSPDAEQGVLSSCLLAPRETISLCVEEGITPDLFHIPQHSEIYRQLIRLWEENKPIDFISLTQHLRDMNMLDRVGGAALVTALFTFLPTAANAEHYIEILKEKHELREGIKFGTEFAARAYDSQGDVPGWLDELERRAMAIRLQKRKQMRSMKDLTMQAIGVVQATYDSRGEVLGLSTGFPDLDHMTGGLQASEMFVLAARPSMGKTAMAMNWVEHIAIDKKKPVAVFSLEMGAEQLAQRMLCSRARVNLARVRDGFLSERDFPALQRAASDLAQANIFIDDTSGLSILELKAKARRLKLQHGVVAVFIDYLQLLRSGATTKRYDKQQEVSDASAGCKELAKELGLPVVVLAQLNRTPESRTGDSKGRPRLSDLRDSGSIEQDADVVAMLYREEYYADTDEERKEAEGKSELILAKQRNGATGVIPLCFLKEFTRFTSRAHEPEPDTQPSLLREHPKSSERRKQREE